MLEHQPVPVGYLNFIMALPWHDDLKYMFISYVYIFFVNTYIHGWAEPQKSMKWIAPRKFAVFKITDPKLLCFVLRMYSKRCGFFSAKFNIEEREILARMDSPYVQKLISNNVDRGLIMRTLRRKLEQTGLYLHFVQPTSLLPMFCAKLYIW